MEVLRQFQADRTYILEFDRKLHTEVCTYEIAVEGIKETQGFIYSEYFY